MRAYWPVLAFCVCIACNSASEEGNGEKAQNGLHQPGDDEMQKPQPPAGEISVVAFKNDSTTGWGYNVYIDNVRYIHQPIIPAVQGSQGFASEEEARRAAELVGYKIRNGIMPPSVTSQELDSLGITYGSK